VQSLLTDPKRRTSRPGRARHLLSMIATCAVCHGPLTVRFARNPDGEYFCRDGSHVRIAQRDLDDHVTALILAMLADPEEYAFLADNGDDDRLQAVREELAEARAYRDKMIRLVERQKIDPDIIVEAAPTWKANIQRLEAEEADLETPSVLRTHIDPRGDVRKQWKAMTPVARRTLVRMLFTKIEVVRSVSPGHTVPVADRVDIEPMKARPVTH
jgi:site-specific DNA recombinase